MLVTIPFTLIVLAVLAQTARTVGRLELIARRPYNNPYGDATAARDGRLLG